MISEFIFFVLTAVLGLSATVQGDRDFRLVENLYDAGSNVVELVAGKDDRRRLNPRFGVRAVPVRGGVRVQADIPVVLRAPRVEGNLRMVGPLGGEVSGAINGGIGPGLLGRGLVAALDRSFDVRAPISRAGFGASSSITGTARRGLFGGLKLSGAGKAEGRLHGLLGRTVRGMLSGRVDGGLTVDQPGRIVGSRAAIASQCTSIPARCQSDTPTGSKTELFTFDPLTQSCRATFVCETCLTSNLDVFTSALECEAVCLRGQTLPQVDYTV